MKSTFAHYNKILEDSYEPPAITHGNNHCEHCFCIQEYVNGKKHNKCCMCGTRSLALEYTITCTTGGFK